MSNPIPITVMRHPWLANRFTHMVAQADALKRGWLTTADLDLGTWRSRRAALTAARKLERRGVVRIIGRGCP